MSADTAELRRQKILANKNKRLELLLGIFNVKNSLINLIYFKVFFLNKELKMRKTFSILINKFSKLR